MVSFWGDLDLERDLEPDPDLGKSLVLLTGE